MHIYIYIYIYTYEYMLLRFMKNGLLGLESLGLPQLKVPSLGPYYGFRVRGVGWLMVWDLTVRGFRVWALWFKGVGFRV